MKRSVTQRLNRILLATGGVIAMLFLAAGVVMQVRWNDDKSRQICLLLDTLAAREHDNLANELFERRAPALDIRLAEISAVENVLQVVLYDAQGQALAAASRGRTLPLDIPAIRPAALGHDERYSVEHDWRSMRFLKPVTALGEVMGWMEIRYDLSMLRKQLVEFFLFYFVLLAMTLLSMLALLRRRLHLSLVKPLQDLGRAMESLQAAGDPAERSAPGPSPSDADLEVAGLWKSFQEMAGRLSESYSELAEAGRTVRENEARYRSIVENIQDMYYRTDIEGRLVLLSPSTARQLGYAGTGDMLGRFAAEFWVEPEARRELLRRIEAQGAVKDYEVLLKTRDGRHLLVSTTSAHYHDADGKVLGVEGIFRDITERKRSEEALRASEARFRAFMDYLPGYVLIKDSESRPVFFNQRFLEAFPGEGWLGKKPGEVFPVDVAADMLENDRKALADGFVLYTEDWRDRHGERRILETRKFRIRQENGQDLIGAIITDITAQRQSEEKHRVLFHSAPDAIFLIKDDRIVDCNPRTLELFACPAERLLGRNPGELSPEAQPGGRNSLDLAAEMVEFARERGTHTFEWLHTRCDGTAFTVEVRLTAMSLLNVEYVVAFVRDISERKQMQEMMVQAEKMVSLGGIAAGIAHEINNPLGIVLQAVQNLKQRLRPDFPKNQAAAREAGLDLALLTRYAALRKIDVFCDDIESAAQRAAAIIRHMLDFSRGGGSRRMVCDLAALADRAVALAGSDFNLKKSYDFKRIEIVREYGQDLPMVPCTETEIEQVVLNLLRNAAQAMAQVHPPVERPRIVIRLKGTAQAVRLEVEDNGPGMPPEVQRRAFEPFFTTKPPGEGTGLGLSVSYFIVTKGHGGTMQVESKPGSGTRFIIELPRGQAA